VSVSYPLAKITEFDTGIISQVLDALRANGSVAAPGFMKPEGVVVFHTASGQLYKKTIDGDAVPKGVSR
jgi:hypothetical protein